MQETQAKNRKSVLRCAALLLALLLPTIGATTRRLHDTGKTGWFQLCAFICGIGFLIPLFFCIQAGDPNENQYGPAPAETSDSAE